MTVRVALGVLTSAFVLGLAPPVLVAAGGVVVLAGVVVVAVGSSGNARWRR